MIVERMSEPGQFRKEMPTIEKLVELQKKFPRAIYPIWDFEKKRFEGFAADNNKKTKLQGNAIPVCCPDDLCYTPEVSRGMIELGAGGLPLRPVRISLDYGKSGDKINYALTWKEAQFVVYPEIWNREFGLKDFEVPLRIAEWSHNLRGNDSVNAYCYGQEHFSGSTHYVPTQFYRVDPSMSDKILSAFKVHIAGLLGDIQEENAREARFLKLPINLQKAWIRNYHTSLNSSLGAGERNNAERVYQRINALFWDEKRLNKNSPQHF